MTVVKLFDIKCRELLKTMNRTTYENFKMRAEYENKSLTELIYMSLEITEHDIRANGGYNGALYAEIKAMHENKLLASNKHRQEHGHIDRYWLTKKGLKVALQERMVHSQ